MAELDYSAALDRLEEYVSQAAVAEYGAEGVNVWQELEEPTADQCPAVVLTLDDVSHTVRYMVGALTAGAPDEVVADFTATCWEFSGQGTKDARRKVQALARVVVDAVRAERTLGGVCDWAETPRVVFGARPAGSGIFAVAVVTIRMRLRA